MQQPAMQGISESRRVTQADQARFRVKAPNSQPRMFRVIALDAFSHQIAQRACGEQGRRIACMLFDPAADLVAWLEGADVVAIVARAGCDPAPAATIAGICQPRGVMVTGLVIEPLERSEPAGRATIAGLRPHCSMLVVAADTGYVAEMLEALGA
jgi:hypothetical protein